MDTNSTGASHQRAPLPDHTASRLRDMVFRTDFAISLVVLATIIAAAALAWWVFGSRATTGYVTVPLARGNVTRTVIATGSVNPVLTVGSYVSGVIQEIDCDFNTKVKKGQLCAKIDARPYQTIVEQNQATVATARAQLLKDQADLAYAQINERRYANLSAQNAISGDSYDVAVNALNQARAQVAVDRATIDQRQAGLDAAKVNLGYTNIVAPVDGIVVSRNVTMGQTVASSFQTPTLFLIATDLSKMEVDTNVSESDVANVHDGDRARFTVEAFPDKTFDGAVTQVRQAPQTVQNVVTYDVVITVANPELLLKPGMTATVRVITAERRSVLRVPDSALRYIPGGLSAASTEADLPTPGVWVMRDGRPARVAITTGLDDDTYMSTDPTSTATTEQGCPHRPASAATDSARAAANSNHPHRSASASTDSASTAAASHHPHRSTAPSTGTAPPTLQLEQLSGWPPPARMGPLSQFRSPCMARERAGSTALPLEFLPAPPRLVLSALDLRHGPAVSVLGSPILDR